MITNKIITDCHNIAKGLAPIDSGNLRYNAIKIKNRTQNSFTLNYSLTDAYYIEFLEEGTKNKDGSVKMNATHFIENTIHHLVIYLNAVAQGKQAGNINTITKARLYKDNELLQNNPDYRRFVHAKSIFQHYETEGTTDLYRKR